MLWSFARDRGTPFSAIISRVDTRTRVPIIAVLVVVVFAALLQCIYIGSDTAFNDVISLTITGFYGSYFLPAAFLLWHRIKGNIAPHGTQPAEVQPVPSNPEKPVSVSAPLTADSPADDDSLLQGPLIWGPWKIPGLLGIINNAYACVYMLFVIFWSVWPPATPVTANTMNYSVLVTGGVIIFSVVWYWVQGRKEYKGPTIDEEVKQVLLHRS